MTRDGSRVVHGPEGEPRRPARRHARARGDLVHRRRGGGERRVRDGEAAVAFLLRPTPIEDVFAYARRGEMMPQKTTYFFPKLTSGLLFHPL